MIVRRDGGFSPVRRCSVDEFTSGQCILSTVIHQASLHWVTKNVVRHRLQVVFTAQCSVEIARLPEGMARLLLMREPGELLEALDKACQIRVVTDPSYQD